MARLFILQREVDISGVSGVGIVAEGVEFLDGTCVIRWISDLASTAVHDSIEKVEAIHGHEGATKIVWQS